MRSGTINDRIIEWGTWEELYENYQKATESQGYIVRSISYIVSQAYSLSLRRRKFDRYLCPICWQGSHPSDRRYPLKQRRKLLSRFPTHREFVSFQGGLYKSQLHTLADDDVLLIFDYTRFHETTEVKVHDLGIVLCARDKTLYYDFFASAPHDYHYTVGVMEYFFDNEEIVQSARQVFIWCDGALRTKENLYLWSVLRHHYEVPLHVFIFPPHHGHSLADGHFGVGKRKLRKAYAGGLIATLSNIEEQFSTLKNTNTFTIDVVPHQNFMVSPLQEGIRCYYAFSFPSPNQVACWERFGEEQPTLQDLRVTLLAQ